MPAPPVENRLRFRSDPQAGNASCTSHTTLEVRFSTFGQTTKFTVGDRLIANAPEGRISILTATLEAFVFATWNGGYALTVARPGKLPFTLLEGLNERERKQLGLKLTRVLETRGLSHLAKHISENIELTCTSLWQPLGIAPDRVSFWPKSPKSALESVSFSQRNPWKPSATTKLPPRISRRSSRSDSSSGQRGPLHGARRTGGGPFRGTDQPNFEVAVDEDPVLVTPCFLARIFLGKRTQWRRTTRKVSFDFSITRSVTLATYEGRHRPRRDSAPTRSRTFEVQRITLNDVQSFWFSPDNTLWIRRGEDVIALAGNLSNKERAPVQTALERYLLSRGKLALLATAPLAA